MPEEYDIIDVSPDDYRAQSSVNQSFSGQKPPVTQTTLKHSWWEEVRRNLLTAYKNNLKVSVTSVAWLGISIPKKSNKDLWLGISQLIQSVNRATQQKKIKVMMRKSKKASTSKWFNCRKSGHRKDNSPDCQRISMIRT